ncbi:MAG: hypothetical protein JO257_32350 [Deltaproteobacteria bacterium]|nr:hypothetical protein [Deltaproteobacteria bacterium]
MSSYAKVVIAGALVACDRPPTPRERALALLPAEASIVAAADGSALAAWRRAVDVARPYAPATFACVIDAALSADAAALAHGETGTTIVLVSRRPVATCPAIARVASDVYVATLGNSTIEHGLGPRWTRARDYLATAPIAIAADLGDRHVLAAAETGAAWLAIDAADPDAAQRELAQTIARWSSLGSKLAVTRRGSQVLVRATALDPDEVAALAHDVLAQLDPQPARAALSLPTVHVPAMAPSLRALAAVLGDPVVENGGVIGVRLADPMWLLLRGDIVLGIDSHRITSAAQLTALASALPKRLSVAVRRGEIETVFEVTEE